MRFGNTWETLRKAASACAIVGGGLGLLAAVGFVISENAPWTIALVLGLVIAAILPAVVCLFVAPTLLFSIHVREGWVESRFRDRHILSKAKVCDFERMVSPAGLFAAILCFRGGRKIRVLGASLNILASLNETLMLQSQPEQGDESDDGAADLPRP